MWVLQHQGRSEEDPVARRRQPVEAVIGRSTGRGGEIGRSKNKFDGINVNVSVVGRPKMKDKEQKEERRCC